MATAPGPLPTANSELAAQIVSALLADEFITASEKEGNCYDSALLGKTAAEYF